MRNVDSVVCVMCVADFDLISKVGADGGSLSH